MSALLRRRRKRRWKTLALLAAVVGVLAALLASGAVAERPDNYRVYAAQEDPDNLYFYIDQWHGEEQNGLFAGNFTLEDVEVDGEDAILIYNPDTSLSRLLWTQGADVFLLSAKGLEREDLFQIAENMKW